MYVIEISFYDVFQLNYNDETLFLKVSDADCFTVVTNISF